MCPWNSSQQEVSVPRSILRSCYASFVTLQLALMKELMGHEIHVAPAWQAKFFQVIYAILRYSGGAFAL